MKEEGKLEGWKQIAEYLDMGVRTLQGYEKKHGLPIIRVGKGKKPRVVAYKYELKKWFDTFYMNKDNVEKSKKQDIQNNNIEMVKEAFIPNFHIRNLDKYIRTGLISFLLILIGMIFGTIFISFGRQNSAQPMDFKILGSQLVILDEKGQELWRYDTGHEDLWPEDKYRNCFQFKRHKIGAVFLPRIIIQDLNADGKNEVLFSTRTISEYGAGILYLFNSKGGIKWSYSGGRELIYGNTLYSNDTRIFGLDVCNLDNRGTPEIVLIGGHIPFFPCYLVVLDINGNIQGEFWNSGYIVDMVFKDFNGNGRKEIVVSGTNNEYKQGFIAVFDSNDISGASPQQKSYYTCKDFESSSAKYYIRFPRTDVDLLMAELEFCSNLTLLKNGNISTIARNSNLIYEFNSEFELINIRTSNSFQFNHRKAVQEKKISSVLNEDYLKNLATGLKYYNGKNWTIKHLPANKWDTVNKVFKVGTISDK